MIGLATGSLSGRGTFVLSRHAGDGGATPLPQSPPPLLAASCARPAASGITGDEEDFEGVDTDVLGRSSAGSGGGAHFGGAPSTSRPIDEWGSFSGEGTAEAAASDPWAVARDGSAAALATLLGTGVAVNARVRAGSRE